MKQPQDGLYQDLLKQIPSQMLSSPTKLAVAHVLHIGTATSYEIIESLSALSWDMVSICTPDVEDKVKHLLVIFLFKMVNIPLVYPPRNMEKYL